MWQSYKVDLYREQLGALVQGEIDNTALQIGNREETGFLYSLLFTMFNININSIQQFQKLM